MIVMKFGGTSVGSAEQVRRVTAIVRRELERQPLVVVSAFSTVTDMLIRAQREALKGSRDTEAIDRRHRGVLEDLDLDPGLIATELGQLREILTGIAWLRECTDRTRDLLLSFGERMSAKVVAAHFNRAGIEAKAVAAYDLGLVTDDHFQAARPVADVDQRIRGAHELHRGPLLVVTGFIGKSEAGDVTTLGRGGSDYSATIIGAALDAQEVQVWTDVSGVMTADPTVIPAAQSLDSLSYEEAGELAYYGAKVLHPATMSPAKEKGIPIRVLNTMEPDHPGTLIVPAGLAKHSDHIIKSIVYKENQCLVHITAPRRLLMHGFLVRMFSIFDKYRIVVDMISTSEVTVSVTLAENTHNIDRAIAELSEFSEVTVLRERTIMCCVGQDMRNRKGIAGRIFTCLGRAGVSIQMISQGASEVNIAFVVGNEDIGCAVTSLHREFFE